MGGSVFLASARFMKISGWKNGGCCCRLNTNSTGEEIEREHDKIKDTATSIFVAVYLLYVLRLSDHAYRNGSPG